MVGRGWWRYAERGLIIDGWPSERLSVWPAALRRRFDVHKLNRRDVGDQGSNQLSHARLAGPLPPSLSRLCNRPAPPPSQSMRYRHTDVTDGRTDGRTRAIAPLQLHSLSWFVTPAHRRRLLMLHVRSDSSSRRIYLRSCSETTSDILLPEYKRQQQQIAGTRA